MISNSYIGRIFTQLADLLEIEGANPFRVRAYRNAAREISQYSINISELIARGQEFPKIPGLGKDLSAKAAEIAATGRLSLLEETEKRLPKELKSVSPRVLLDDAEEIAESFCKFLRTIPQVQKVVLAGSYRRQKETVGDLDILVAIEDSLQETQSIIERCTSYDEVSSVLTKGPTKISVQLRAGIQVDLRLISAESYGAALQYFTGSKAHNIAVRTLGARKGLKINEYGVYSGTRRVAGRTEEEVYRSVGLSYIEPELRESHGEIEAARDGTLPKLISLRDMRGDLHAHTVATDGRSTLSELAAAAIKRGYEYLAITDHSQHLKVARGLDPHRLLEQIREIDKINAQHSNLRLLKSCEVDILDNGSLDLPDSILKELDFTVCSIHYKFNLPIEQQTERIIRAMDNPYFSILAHPTGRLLEKRSPYEVNIEKLMRAACDRGCFLELNSQPDRLDLRDDHCRLARELGVKIAVSTDAHHISEFGYMRFGIAQARRGWLEPQHVLNTRPWTELRKLFKRS